MTDNRETIMGHLKNALEAITTGNGFNYTVKTVSRSKRDLAELDELPGIAIGDPEVRHEQVGDYFDRVWMTVLVVGVVSADDPETEVNYFARDIIKATKTRAETPHKQMGNVACPDVNIGDSYSEDGKGFVQIEFEWYFTEEEDA